PLHQALQSLLSGWCWQISEEKRGGIRGLYLQVEESAEEQPSAGVAAGERQEHSRHPHAHHHLHGHRHEHHHEYHHVHHDEQHHECHHAHHDAHHQEYHHAHHPVPYNVQEHAPGHSGHAAPVHPLQHPLLHTPLPHGHPDARLSTHSAPHVHRSLPTILALIGQSALPQPVKELSSTMFSRLAEAEAAVHGCALNEVHFHEVGAVDAIVDICGAAYAYWALGVTECTASAVAPGSGFVECAHGRLPLPGPAVAELLRRFAVPLRPDKVLGELITPTGAVILVTLAQRFGCSPLTRIDRIGHGLGSREIAGQANMLRLLAQESRAGDQEEVFPLLQDRISQLTTHIDDMNPEWYGHLSEQLWQAGIVDLTLTPMTMKKGRPGIRLEVLVAEEKAKAVAALLLRHSSALGVRVQSLSRWLLPRTLREVVTPWGSVRIKEAAGVGKVEYADLLQLAQAQNWSMAEAQQKITPWLYPAELSVQSMEGL
uniref:nickel pincer cofactor biosynthesis protein LarC n=1 Tax=Candidatus Magnetaquicoccus inordinatus TaxID=2496818 RepID=UPI00102D13E1